jgi:hypothetical protein
MARTPASRRLWLIAAASVAVLPVLFQPLPVAASSTGTLFGVTGVDRSTVSSINLGTGAVKQIAQLGLPPNFNAQITNIAGDPATHRIFALRLSVISPNPPANITMIFELITINSQSGAQMAITTVNGGIGDLQFDPSSNTLYALTQGGPQGVSSVVRLDPNTGSVSTVAGLPPSGVSIDSMVVAPQTHTIYVNRQDASFPRPPDPPTRIIAVDTVANAIVGTSPVLTRAIRSISYDSSSNRLFGVTECCPQDLLQIDPSLGTETLVANVNNNTNQSFMFHQAVDPLSHTVFLPFDFFSTFPDETHIFSVNTQTGVSTLSPLIATGADSLYFETGTGPIDTSPPSTSITISPAPNAAGLNNTDVTVNLSATDPDGVADVATIQYSAAGAQAIAPTIVAGSSTSFTVTAAGVTTVTYFATDSAGNTEAAHTQVIRIDKTPPVTSIALSPAPNAAGWNKTDVTVNLSATDPDGVADVTTIQYSATGAQPIAPTVVTNSSVSFTLTVEGVTTVNYFAQDKAGNTEAARTQVIRIDKTPPTISYTGNAGTYTVDQTVAITCTATDPHNANGTAGSGLASTTCTNVNAPAYTFPLGPNTLAASATDIAGNAGIGSTTFTVQVNSSSLCSLTTRFIQSSPASQTSPALAQAQRNRLCNLLAIADFAPNPARKALVEAYQKGLTLLVEKGLLTPGQAAILLKLSQAL